MAINYDVEIDMKIINTVTFAKQQTANMSELRENAHSTTITLDKHLKNMERWGLIKDIKPDGNGKARKIKLRKDYGDCMDILMKLKKGIDTVNEYFP